MKNSRVKVLFLITLICLQLPLFIKAQFLQTTRFGVNMFSVRDIPMVIPATNFEAGKGVGMSIGGGIKYKLSPQWAIQAEYMYVFKRAAAELKYRIITGDTGAYTTTQMFSSNLHYLQVPIVAQYRYHFKNGVLLFANAGLYSAIKFREHTENWVPDELTEYSSRNNYFQFFDYGGVASIGTAFTFEECKGMIAPEIRLTQCFCNSTEFARQKPTIEFSIGYVSTFGE